MVNQLVLASSGYIYLYLSIFIYAYICICKMGYKKINNRTCMP